MRDHPADAAGNPPQAVAGVTISSVDTWQGFNALRRGWEALEARDPEGSLFLSWAWLAQAFRPNPGRWRVIAAHRGDDLVCVLPLKYRVRWSRSRQAFETVIEAGGRLLWSEYTGFLCDPAVEAPAIAAIAEHLRDRPFAALSIRYDRSRRRAARFLSGFDGRHWSAGFRDYRINDGATDNLLCPEVALPADYPTYLAGSLGRGTRRNFRRFMERRTGDGGDLRVTFADDASLDRDLAVLLDIWRRRWAREKGTAVAAEVADSYARVMRAAHRLGCLHLPVLWQGDRPLGALGHVLDRRHGRVHCVVSCRDADGPVRNAGFILHAHSIRWAIGQRFSVYDFSHGDEAYKFDFGAVPRRVAAYGIRRRGPQDRFDPICVNQAMRRVIRYIDDGRTAEAAAGARQILPLVR